MVTFSCVLSHLSITAPSDAPLNLSGHAVNSTTIALWWDTIAAEKQNGIIRHYLVSVMEVETDEVDMYTAVGTQLNISGLHPYYTYTCVVAAVTNSVGPFSHNISIITPQGGKYKICISKLSYTCSHIIHLNINFKLEEAIVLWYLLFSVFMC